MSLPLPLQDGFSLLFRCRTTGTVAELLAALFNPRSMLPPPTSTLLAEQKPEKLERACIRWHGRLETEATFLTLAESQLALAALASLCAGERDAIEVLRRLLHRVRPKDSYRGRTRSGVLGGAEAPPRE